MHALPCLGRRHLPWATDHLRWSPMKWRKILALTVSAALSAVGCVPADAGYQDVRSATSHRIQQNVHWDAHDFAQTSQKETRELLGRPLTANSAVQIALLNNQGVQAAFEDLGVARASLVQALRLPNPTLEAALRFKRSTNPDIDLMATLDLTDFLFLPLQSGVANAELDAAKARVLGSVLDLALDVRVAFYAYQAALQQFELRKSVIDALGTSFEVAQRLHAAGNVSDLSLENERALYEESRVTFARAEATLSATREELSARMGLWGRGSSWSAEPRLAEPAPADAALTELESRAVERSLDLEMLRHRYEAQGKRAHLAKLRGWLPELRAGVSAERGDREWGVGPAAALELPLFYQGQGETGLALAEMRRARKLYADTALRVRSAARGTVARLRAAAESAAYYSQVLLPLRQRIVADTQLEYNAMSAGVFQLLQARRDQIAAAAGYVDLLREYWTLRAQVDQLAAGRLPRSVLGLGDGINAMAPGRGTADAH
jgi:outer membrane protein, heavy metal efflux system